MTDPTLMILFITLAVAGIGLAAYCLQQWSSALDMTRELLEDQRMMLDTMSTMVKEATEDEEEYTKLIEQHRWLQDMVKRVADGTATVQVTDNGIYFSKKGE